MSTQSFLIFLPASLIASLSQSDDDTESLLSGTHLTLKDLSEPSTEVPYKALERILENAHNFWPHPGLGLNYGNNLAAMDFGLVGQSMATSPTLREAIDLFMSFYKFGLHILEVSTDIEGDCLTVRFKHAIPEAQGNRFFIDAAFAALCRLISSIYPGSFESSAQMKADDGGYGPAYQALFSNGVIFNGRENSVTLRGLNLNSRLKHSNALNAAQLRAACETELRKRSHNGGISTKVRDFIQMRKDNPPKLSETAKHLGFSNRNLRRQLAKSGETYRNILNEERGKYMIQLLAIPELSITEISHMLGYDNYANFSRAFKKLHGITPAQFR